MPPTCRVDARSLDEEEIAPKCPRYLTPSHGIDIKTACYRGNAKGCEIHRALGDLEDEVRVMIEIDRAMGSSGIAPESLGRNDEDWERPRTAEPAPDENPEPA